MSAANSLDPRSSMWAWLAYDLRFYRQKHGLSLSQMGHIIGAARSTVSNYEAGRRYIDDRQAKLLDDHFNTGGHFQHLLAFARLNHDPGWSHQYLIYETSATVIKIYQVLVAPGLLQTADYARALFTAGGVKDPEASTQKRVGRQEILKRPEPPLFWVLLDEAAITRPVGGAEVMRAQLARLLEASELPHVTIRIVPRSAGAYLGVDGAFMVITSGGTDLAYTEAAGGGRLVLETSEVQSFAIRYDRIGAQALPEGSSRILIQEAMEAMR